MAERMDVQTEIEEILREHEPRWDDFRRYRASQGIWTRLRERRLPIELQPELGEYAEGIDIQSSVLESELALRKSILELNPIKVDVVAQEQGETAKADAEDVRIWFASQLARLDEGMRISDPNSAAQVADGLIVWAWEWKMPEEPEPPARERGESDAVYAARHVLAREQAFREMPADTFNLRRVPLGSIMFWPLDEPQVFLERSRVPYLEWRKLKDREGRYLRMSELGELAFVGDYEETDAQRYGEKAVTLVRFACKRGEYWHMYEYVTADEDALNFADNAVPVEDYECPMQPYRVLPGILFASETDPHLRFRPMLYPLYVETFWQNYLRTLLAALTRKAVSDDMLYIRVQGLTEHAARVLDEAAAQVGIPVEGAGAERRLVFRRPEPGSGELMIAPEIAPIPVQFPATLQEELAFVERTIENLRTNRFLVGQAYTETAQGTGSAVIGQTQQAQIPYSDLLRLQAKFWREVFSDMRDAILYWGGDKRYYVVTSGEEPILRGKTDPGSVIYVDERKMARRFQIIVHTRNVTDMEQAQLAAAAYADYDRGTITFEQLLDRLGYEDPLKQIRELNRFRHLLAAREQFKAQEDAERAIRWQVLSGLNLGPVQPPPAPPTGGQPQAGAPNAAEPQPIPMGRPVIAPPPVGGPQGTNAAMAGTQI